MQDQLIAWGKSLLVAAALWCWRCASTLLWVGALLALVFQVGRSSSAVVLLVPLLAAAAVAFHWFPKVAPGLGDWRRDRMRKANRRARLLGYQHAVGMNLIESLDAYTMDWAIKSPVRRLPNARLVITPDTVSLFARQTVASTDESLQTRAEAYAPVLNRPAQFVRVERVTDSNVRIVWGRTAPVVRLAKNVPFPGSTA